MTAPASGLPESIRLIDDLHLGRPHVIGTYALLGDEPALVDPGPASTLANLEAGLRANGVALSDIRALLLTHIHLDHAGATGTLVKRYPHLRVYVHERGAPHMIAPEKLISSATRLYGERMDELWGEFLPVPEANISVLRGGETITLGDRSLRVFYTPGHASHHVVYFEEALGAAFVGDTAGVRLPGSQYARPATPPPDVDLAAWDQSLALLRDLNPSMLLLTHFGPALDAQAHLDHYRARLHRWADLVRKGLGSGASEAEQIDRLQALANVELADTPQETFQYQQATPLEQTWRGLARYWQKQAEKQQKSTE